MITKMIASIFMIIGICVLYVACSADLMGDCRERGGRVERVYGGSGWICEGDE